MVVQQCHNRQVAFANTADFELYLSVLRKLKEVFGVSVYIYFFMTNHVHLLLAPDDTTSDLGQLMKILAACMTRSRNKLEERSGTLWETDRASAGAGAGDSSSNSGTPRLPRLWSAMLLRALLIN
jgi:putative transposase